MGVDPKLTRLMEAVTVSKYVMPVTVSWHIWVDIIMVMAAPTKKPCAMVSSCGMLMVVCGELPPIKDLAISAKPGGSICFCVMGHPSGVFASWVEIVKVFTVVGMVSFECPILWDTEKEPQVWALLHLLYLYSHMVSGSAGSEGWEEVTFTQCNDGSLARTSSSVNDVSSSINSLNSFTHAVTGMVGSPGWLGFFCPGLQGLCIG